MRIQSIETFTRRHVSVVRVRSEDGAEGIGQISPYSADISAQVLHRHVAPIALGSDPLDTTDLCRRVMEGTYKFPGSFVCRALAGVDTACWDLRGKLEGRSVSELLGRKRKAVPAYGSSMRRDISPAEEAERLRRLRDEQGFRAFKVRVGSVCGHDADPWPGRTEELIPTVRKAVGEEVSLMADGNSCYTPKRALEVARLLSAEGYSWFEEPCPYWELEWTAEVREGTDVPVAGGEQDNDLPTWRRMLEMPAVDIAQPDICYIGGLTRALQVAEMARAAELDCVPHSANRSMVTVFTLHMLSAIPNAGPFMEWSIEPTKWVEGLFEDPLEVVDGEVNVPAESGWGVTVSADWLDGADRQVSEA